MLHTCDHIITTYGIAYHATRHYKGLFLSHIPLGSQILLHIVELHSFPVLSRWAGMATALKYRPNRIYNPSGNKNVRAHQIYSLVKYEPEAISRRVEYEK